MTLSKSVSAKIARITYTQFPITDARSSSVPVTKFKVATLANGDGQIKRRPVDCFQRLMPGDNILIFGFTIFDPFGDKICLTLTRRRSANLACNRDQEIEANDGEMSSQHQGLLHIHERKLYLFFEVSIGELSRWETE